MRSNWELPSATNRYFTAEEGWDAATALDKVAKWLRKNKQEGKTLIAINVAYSDDGSVGITAVIE